MVREFSRVSVRGSASVTYVFVSRTTGHAHLPVIGIVSVAKIMTKKNWIKRLHSNRMVRQMRRGTQGQRGPLISR